MSSHSSEEFSEDEFEEDDEATMAEEELQGDNDVNEELRLLNEEGEMSVEELRRRYCVDPEPMLPNDVVDQPCSSALPSSGAVNPLKSYFMDGQGQGSDEEEDEEYVPKVNEYWKKEVRIGNSYQAEKLPEPNVDNSDYVPTIESSPIWKPLRTDDEPKKLRAFLEKVNTILHEREREANGTEEPEPPQAPRTPKSTAFADNEDALYALYVYNYDPDEAIKHIPFPPANGPNCTGPTVWHPMTPDEVDSFEHAFREHGKNFSLIQKSEMPDRKVGELIHFYYVWKKSERHDIFVDANRALGLQDANSTKTIDPMDLIVDQQMGEVNGISYTATTALLTAQNSAAHPHHKHWLSVHQTPPPHPKQP